MVYGDACMAAVFSGVVVISCYLPDSGKGEALFYEALADIRAVLRKTLCRGRFHKSVILSGDFNVEFPAACLRLTGDVAGYTGFAHQARSSALLALMRHH